MFIPLHDKKGRRKTWQGRGRGYSWFGGSFNTHLGFLVLASWVKYRIIQQKRENQEGQEEEVRRFIETRATEV